MNGLEQALEKIGGVARLAEHLEITTQAISQWKLKGVVPAPRSSDEPNRILEVERATGVHRHFLNPHVYPEAPEVPVAAA